MASIFRISDCLKTHKSFLRDLAVSRKKWRLEYKTCTFDYINIHSFALIIILRARLGNTPWEIAGSQSDPRVQRPRARSDRATVIFTISFRHTGTFTFSQVPIWPNLPRIMRARLSRPATYRVGACVVPMGTMLERRSTSRIVDSVTGR